MVVDTQMIWGGTSLIPNSCFCCFRIMEKNDDLVGPYHDSYHVGMICLYPESRYSKTPPAYRNKQQTYVGSSLCTFPCCLQLWYYNTSIQSFDFHVAFQLWYASNIWLIILAQSQKHIPNNPWTLQAMKKRSTKCHIFVWEYVPNNPLARWFDCVFCPKNFVHDFIILIHLKSYTYNWGICKSSSYNSRVAQFSTSYLLAPS
jgi:hypothetical protein